jgi:structural maintenance of chromosome 2
MFESVGLNVNNPNFMIMQGKITKVVNMKPKETLGMIEETVGASTYQTKRDKAMKDLEEKGKQVVEIQHVIILKLLRICLL